MALEAWDDQADIRVYINSSGRKRSHPSEIVDRPDEEWMR